MTWATIGDNMGGAQDSTEESAKDKDGRIMASPGETDPMAASDEACRDPAFFCFPTQEGLLQLGSPRGYSQYGKGDCQKGKHSATWSAQ